ncbi:MAG TPA: A24 family peptidase [Streptosporangiaceae bacterium]|nr:A24 family peptidase [Gaiellales bacterium]
MIVWTLLAGAGGLLAGRLATPLTEPYCCRSRLRTAGIPLVAALVSALFAYRLGATPAVVAFLYLGVVGTLLAFVDAAVKRLPDPFTLPSYGVGIALLAGAAPFTGDGAHRFLSALIGMAVLWSFYGVQHVLLPHALGRGDVKLAGILGLYLGWLGQDAWRLGALAGLVLSGLYSAFLLLTRRGSRKSEIPMGPFMLAGALLAIAVQ